MKSSFRPVIFAALAVATVSAQSSTQSTGASSPVTHFGTWGVDLTGMDKGVRPGDDFDNFVNGAWKARTEIPADQPSTGVGFDVFNRTQAEIRGIIADTRHDVVGEGERVELLADATINDLAKRGVSAETRDVYNRIRDFVSAAAKELADDCPDVASDWTAEADEVARMVANRKAGN